MIYQMIQSAGSYYLRQERQGLLVGPYEGADKMQLCEDWYDSGPPQGTATSCWSSSIVIFHLQSCFTHSCHC